MSSPVVQSFISSDHQTETPLKNHIRINLPPKVKRRREAYARTPTMEIFQSTRRKLVFVDEQ